MRIKTNHSRNSFIFLLVSVVLVITAFCGVSAAWFTNSKFYKVGGVVPTIDAKVYWSGVTKTGQSGNVYTFTLAKPASSTTAFAVMPSFSFKSVSSVDVYFRVKFTFSATPSFLGFTLGDGWYSADSTATTDYAKITTSTGSGWLYFKTRGDKALSSNDKYPIISAISISNYAGWSSSPLTITLTYQVVPATTAGMTTFGNPSVSGWNS